MAKEHPASLLANTLRQSNQTEPRALARAIIPQPRPFITLFGSST